MSKPANSFLDLVASKIRFYRLVSLRPKLKIGFITHPGMGGSGIMGVAMATELAKRGHDIHLIVYKKPFRIDEGLVKVHKVSTKSYPMFEFFPITVASANKIEEVISKYDLDLLSVHYVMPYSVSAYVAKQMSAMHGKNIPVVTTIHGSDVHTLGLRKQFRGITRFSLEASDGIVSVANFLGDIAKEEFGIKNVKTIYNFVDTERFYRRELPKLRKKYAKRGEKVIVHFSNFRKIKNVEHIVRVFNKIHKKVPSVLLLGGDGPERPVAEALAKKLGINEKIFFLGKRKKPELIYSIGDLFILLSTREGCPLTILEAMACKTPVLVTRAGGMPEIVKEGYNGVIGEVGDIKELANKAIAVLTDEHLRQKMAENALRSVNDNYTIARITRQYEDYFYDVLSKK